MFKSSVFNIFQMGNMHKNCPHCGQRFEVEPGFFYGAMYVGYAFSVATLIASLVAVNILVSKPTITHYLGTAISAILLLFPINFRYSRVLMLYGFGGISYQSGKASKNTEATTA
jgi:hypothetical protein